MVLKQTVIEILLKLNTEKCGDRIIAKAYGI